MLVAQSCAVKYIPAVNAHLSAYGRLIRGGRFLEIRKAVCLPVILCVLVFVNLNDMCAIYGCALGKHRCKDSRLALSYLNNLSQTAHTRYSFMGRRVQTIKSNNKNPPFQFFDIVK